MNLNTSLSSSAHSVRSAVLFLMLAIVPATHAQTLWTGPTTNFTQTTHNSTDADVLVAGKVALSRGATQWLFNTAAGETSPGTASPKDTMWAFGALSNYATLSYKTFDSLRNGDLGQVLGVPADGGTTTNMVLHLTNENIYLSITFTAWGEHGAGGFAYTRSTPAVASPTPTVSITNPVGGSVFSAPASLKLGATATVSSGAVTNVAFFATNATSTNALGSTNASPFKVTGSSLAAGNYSLIAVATAAGVSGTSAVVNVSIVSPVAVSLSVPAIAGGHFSFGYSDNPGLSYIIEKSSNLINWVPIATNVASANPTVFTDSSGLGNNFFYDVVRLPNP